MVAKPTEASTYTEIRRVPRANCVAFAKSVRPDLNLKTRDGWARTIKTNTQVPAIGSIVLTRESWTGHVAYVVDIDYQRGELILAEQNYKRGYYTVGRRLPLTSRKIVGYVV